MPTQDIQACESSSFHDLPHDLWEIILVQAIQAPSNHMDANVRGMFFVMKRVALPRRAIERIATILVDSKLMRRGRILESLRRSSLTSDIALNLWTLKLVDKYTSSENIGWLLVQLCHERYMPEIDWIVQRRPLSLVDNLEVILSVACRNRDLVLIRYTMLQARFARHDEIEKIITNILLVSDNLLLNDRQFGKGLWNLLDWKDDDIQWLLRAAGFGSNDIRRGGRIKPSSAAFCRSLSRAWDEKEVGFFAFAFDNLQAEDIDRLIEHLPVQLWRREFGAWNRETIHEDRRWQLMQMRVTKDCIHRLLQGQAVDSLYHLNYKWLTECISAGAVNIDELLQLLNYGKHGCAYDLFEAACRFGSLETCRAVIVSKCLNHVVKGADLDRFTELSSSDDIIDFLSRSAIFFDAVYPLRRAERCLVSAIQANNLAKVRYILKSVPLIDRGFYHDLKTASDILHHHDILSILSSYTKVSHDTSSID